jgi:hypothetical protein
MNQRVVERLASIPVAFVLEATVASSMLHAEAAVAQATLHDERYPSSYWHILEELAISQLFLAFTVKTIGRRCRSFTRGRGSRPSSWPGPVIPGGLVCP